MTYKIDGYYGGTVARVYGYDSKGIRVMAYKGYWDRKREYITLYPYTPLNASSEPIKKVTVHVTKLGREGFR